MELLSLNEVRLTMLLQEMNNFDEINNFFINSYWNKIGIFVNTSTLFWKNKKITIEWENPLFALNEEHSNMSLETTKQHEICR